MANTPKKVKDPTEAALSAIQDALSVRATPAEPPPPSFQEHEAPATEESVSEPTWRATRPHSPADEILSDDEIRAPEEHATSRRPANDDRESIGQILRTLQRRP